MRALYHHRTQGREVEAVHILGFAGGLEELGYQVEIVGPPGVRVDREHVATPSTGKKTTVLGWIARHAPQAAFELLEIGYNLAAVPRLWKRCGDDTALLYERYALYNAAGVLVGKLRGIPTVLELNDISSVDRTRQGKRLAMPWLAAWFERRILHAADGLVVVSGYLRDRLVEAGLPAEKIRVTPNAVERGRFDPEREDGRAVRERWGLGGKTVIGFAGSFAKWHGPDFLVRAFARLAGDVPEAALLLVGDGARRAETEALVRELGLEERVVFTGRVPHGEIPAYVAAMDLGVMPRSNLFGSPMKVFEYMAMGRPAVAPRYIPLEEAVTHGETGLLFPPDDEAALTAALRELVLHPERRRAMGAAARRKVLTQHQWVHNARVVAELAARNPRGRATSGRREMSQVGVHDV